MSSSRLGSPSFLSILPRASRRRNLYGLLRGIAGTVRQTRLYSNPSDVPNDRATSSNHHDLPSFLAYAQRADLPPTSSTYVGTHYEYTVLHTLSRYGLSLTRVGGRDDHGIDLLGTWRHLTSTTPEEPPLKVFIQCKVLVKRSGPNLVRELEGAFAGAPAAWKGPNVLGCLVASTLPTASLRETMQRCRVPMMFLTVEKEIGVVKAWIWNWAARETGLVGVEATTRYARVEDEKGEEEEANEVVLTHGRQVVVPHGTGVGIRGLDLGGSNLENGPG